jgi:hypothetical protein
MHHTLTDILFFIGNITIISFITTAIYRFNNPSKKTLISRGCRFVKFQMSQSRKRCYYTMPRQLRSDLKLNVRGINKHNCREITDKVLQKLVEDNVLELQPHESVDVYFKV